jgi:hypothetical protein
MTFSEPTWSLLIKQFVLFWPLCLLIGWVGGWLILTPLRAARRAERVATQFRMADFLVLLAVLLVVGGLPFFRREETGERRLLTDVLFLHSLFIVWWWWGLRLIARAQVRAPKARAAALGLAVPLACGGSVGFLAGPVAVSGRIARGIEMTGDIQAQGNELVDFLLWATKVVPFWGLLGFAAFWGGNRLARWAVRHRLDGEPEEDEPF